MTTRDIATVGESSWEKVKANQASKLMSLAPPWLLWPLIAGVGTALHALSGEGQGAAWSAVGLTLASGLLTVVTWLVSHGRGIFGRGSSTTTTAAVSLWVTVCSVAGISSPVVWWFYVVGGLVLAVSWNLRTVIRAKVGVTGAMTDPLAFLFDQAKEKASVNGARMATVNATERKIEAVMALPAGQKTVSDVQKRTEYLESAMGLPPGTVIIAADEDRADRAKVTLSDPRILRHAIHYPGPSRPGASIAEALRPGIWQDGDDVGYVIVGNHLQVMGKSGSGKSLGAGWNLLGEMFTRHDVAVLAADISKGEQTLGPCREGLHRLELDKAGTEALIREVYAQIRPRTDWLSAHGFTAWEEGCGLTYWVLWLEEVAKIFNAISDKHQEMLLEIIKEIRSGGGSVVMSLQRADWSQMPTLVRGQLSKMCFGVENSHDAGFGLSEAQDDAGCRPELWGTRHPGMAYLDAPSVDLERIAMPLRTFLWDKAGQQMRELVAEFPASGKTVDEFTTRIAAVQNWTPARDDDEGQDAEDDGLDGWRAEDDLDTEDPDPSLDAGIDDTIADDPDGEVWEFTRPTPTTTETARQALVDQLCAWFDEGRDSFATADLSPIWSGAGMTRQWAQSRLKALRGLGVLGYDDDTQRHTLLRRPEAA